jgi:intracellular sulfur oxidation DsrE/DsrF family protein
MKSIVKKGIALAGLGMLATTLVGCGGGADMSFRNKSADNGYKAQKVVYHMNDINWGFRGLRNIKNHLNAVGDKNVEIIAVFHSSGGFILVDGKEDKKGHKFGGMINELANRGVKFAICANTIRGKKLNKDKINLHAEVIPSGVAEVAELQYKGYVYVKP